MDRLKFDHQIILSLMLLGAALLVVHLITYDVVNRNGWPVFVHELFLCVLKTIYSNLLKYLTGGNMLLSLVFPFVFWIFWIFSKSYQNSFPFQDKFLKVIGDKHPHFEFLQLLSSKCSFNIFDSEHVCCILSLISTSGLGSNNLEAFSIELLLVRTIVSHWISMVLLFPF